jgi:CPA1 family monovalent cation:H+ antiporter
LIFEAAYHLDFTDFRKSARAIFTLAVPGVMFTIALTAALLVASSRVTPWVSGFGWSHALVFSALIAATDPIAVVALFKRLGAPRRLAVLTEGESLINDGTAIVLFTIISATVSSGSRIAVADAALDFVKVVGLGVLVGGVIAVLTSQILRRVDEPMIEITLTMVTAYGSFVLAERWHASGVIATVTAGMTCGSYAAPRMMNAGTRIAVESFWEYVAFALNSLVFLLIGLEVRVSLLARSWLDIAIAFVIVILARAIVVFGVAAIFRRTSEQISFRWSVMLTWGGLRGALSMVLALALPSDFQGREEIVTMTFGVVLVSIVLQGMTAGPVLRRLGLAGETAS